MSEQLNDFRFIHHIQTKINAAREYDKKRKWKAGNIEIGHVLELAKRQQMKCWKCEDAMLIHSWISNCCYQFSIDRIDNKKPHDFDNCVLACSYCNCNNCDLYTQQNKICDSGCHVEKRSLIYNKDSRESLRLKSVNERLEYQKPRQNEIDEYADSLVELRKEFRIIAEFCKGHTFPSLESIGNILEDLKNEIFERINEGKQYIFDDVMLIMLIKFDIIYLYLKKIHDNKYNDDYIKQIGRLIEQKYGPYSLHCIIMILWKLSIFSESNENIVRLLPKRVECAWDGNGFLC